MLEEVKKYIQQHKLLQKGDRIIVGVSGGADSMCLLHILSRLTDEFDLTLYAVHVNHCLRGEEADRDQKMTEDYCAAHTISFVCIRVQIAEIARERGIGEEEAGRQERYRIFEEERVRNSCSRIAVAHHMDDNAETVLYQLFRGSGIRGLAGMQPERGTLIRPLLCVRRRQIEDYMNENRLSYCTDSTNLTGEYSRNIIRNELTPVIEGKINARAVEHIASAAMMLHETDDYLCRQCEKLYAAAVREEDQVKGRRCLVQADILLQEDPVLQKRLIKSVLERLSKRTKDIEAVHVTDVLALLHRQVGKRLDLPYGMQAVRTYGQLVLFKINEPSEDRTGYIYWQQEHAFLYESEKSEIILGKGEKKLCLSLCKYDKNSKIPKNECTKWFDYDKIMDTLTVRTQQESDFIQINAAGHRKSIKDYLKDQKVPKEDRNSCLLLAAGSHVLWVLGYRGSEGFHADENTENVLVAELAEIQNLKENEESDRG